MKWNWEDGDEMLRVTYFLLFIIIVTVICSFQSKTMANSCHSISKSMHLFNVNKSFKYAVIFAFILNNHLYINRSHFLYKLRKRTMATKMLWSCFCPWRSSSCTKATARYRGTWRGTCRWLPDTTPGCSSLMCRPLWTPLCLVRAKCYCNFQLKFIISSTISPLLNICLPKFQVDIAACMQLLYYVICCS